MRHRHVEDDSGVQGTRIDSRRSFLKLLAGLGAGAVLPVDALMAHAPDGVAPN